MCIQEVYLSWLNFMEKAGMRIALLNLNSYVFMASKEVFMVNLIISSIIAVVAAVMPWSAFANNVNMDFTKADQLIKKYNTVYERPKSCPMESKKFSDLIAKTDAIKDVLKGNCLKKENDKMTEVLESIKSIQDELKNKSMVNNSAVTDALTTAVGVGTGTSTTTGGALSGLKFSALFSNITTMFKKNQCSMEDGRVLEMTADLIYDSTQLGVLAGNQLGLVVAGGGFLISSALRLIDLIFKQRFDFEKAIDRQTFVKLNCSFYEIRRELDAQGALDIENSSSREDYRDVKALLEEVTAELKKIEEDKVNTNKAHSEIERATFQENVGDITELRKTLSKIQAYLQKGVNQNLEIPTETQKLLMISKLAQDYETLTLQLKFYKTLGISSIPMLDDLFLNEIKKFDPLDMTGFSNAMNISAQEFNENHRAKILFHVMRIEGDIVNKEKSLFGKSEKAKTELAMALDKKKELYTAKLLELKKVELRLGNIVAPKEYSGLDDGSENMVAILDNHKRISSQLYGEWGEKFLKFATYKSYDEVKNFNDRYELFNSRYGDIIKTSKKDAVATTYMCQDAQKLRLIFKHADSLVQEGFDFVATNKDLIYSDVKNYYNGKVNEETSSSAYIGPVEKVQRHYKSAIFALRTMKGEVVSPEDTERYLDKPWMGSFYIGRAMIEVSETKNKARLMQDAYEKFGCQKSLSDDF